jgi:hypothetical protein
MLTINNAEMKRCFNYPGLMIILLLSLQVDMQAQTSKDDSRVMLEGKWLPADPATLDFDRLPRLAQSDHSIVNDVRDQDGHRVNQHNYLVHFDGLYWIMWSDGPGEARTPPGQHRNRTPGHDRARQKVSYATSKDGLTWSKSGDITNTPPAPEGWIARGFWVREGKLLALVSSYIAPGYSGPGLALHAFEWDKASAKWNHLGIAYDNALNNFPPAKLPSGEWMMSRRDSMQNVHIMYGGVKAYNQWTSVPVVNYKRTDFRAEEPTWWVLPDNRRIVALYRDNKRSGYIYRSFSDDNGKTWTDPVKTNFPDATSKFNAVRLKDGRYVMVSNPNPKKRDPMTLAISDDGIVFNKMIYLVGGRHIDYPDIMEHDGFIFVAFASAKQTVEVIRVAIADLDKVIMPSTPLTISK